MRRTGRCVVLMLASDSDASVRAIRRHLRFALTGDGSCAPLVRVVPGSAYRIAFGPRAGQKVLTLQGEMLKEAGLKPHLCADINGFSLHAAVRCGADERQALGPLCRCIARPVLASKRGQFNATRQVVRKLTAPGAMAPRT